MCALHPARGLIKQEEPVGSSRDDRIEQNDQLSGLTVVTAIEAVEQPFHQVAVFVIKPFAVAKQNRWIVCELVGKSVGKHL